MKIHWTQQDEENLMALQKIFTIINRKKREAAMAEWFKKMRANHAGQNFPQLEGQARI